MQKILTNITESRGAISRRTLAKCAAAAAAVGAGVVSGSASAADTQVTVMTGSPRRHGSSFVLADEFIRGLKSQGISGVYRFDAAFERVTPCSGCDHCGLGARDCVYRDDMFKLNPHLLASRLIVLCTPLYYFGFSTQIKAVIDRWYAINNRFHDGGRRAVLLATAWNSSDGTMDALVKHYETLTDYMGWTDAGRVLAVGCGTRSAVQSSPFPRQAFELGASVRI